MYKTFTLSNFKNHIVCLYILHLLPKKENLNNIRFYMVYICIYIWYIYIFFFFYWFLRNKKDLKRPLRFHMKEDLLGFTTKQWPTTTIFHSPRTNTYYVQSQFFFTLNLYFLFIPCLLSLTITILLSYFVWIVEYIFYIL